MAKFVRLTLEKGGAVMVNADSVTMFAALGGDETRGTSITFAYAAGVGNAARAIRVTETYPQVVRAFSAR